MANRVRSALRGIFGLLLIVHGLAHAVLPVRGIAVFPPGQLWVSPFVPFYSAALVLAFSTALVALVAGGLGVIVTRRAVGWHRICCGYRRDSPRHEPEAYMRDTPDKIVYWHRELPPVDAEIIGEHTIEATSSHVAGIFSHRDELWNRCYAELMAATHARLVQEIARLGGDYAHVFDESITTKRNDAIGEAWLHGRFAYVLYRRAPKAA